MHFGILGLAINALIKTKQIILSSNDEQKYTLALAPLRIMVHSGNINFNQKAMTMICVQKKVFEQKWMIILERQKTEISTEKVLSCIFSNNIQYLNDFIKYRSHYFNILTVFKDTEYIIIKFKTKIES